MNKKKLGTGLVALALVGVVGIGGSLAWFTDTESRTNTFTTGNINITIDEESTDGSQTGTGYDYENVMPGDVLEKKVTVTLDEDSQDAYVRLVLTLTPDEKSKNILTTLKDKNPDNDITLLNDGTPVLVNWSVSDDNAVAIYDIKTKLTQEQFDWVPFTDVKIPESWGNDFANANFSIDVKAEAIQAENNDDGFAGISSEEIEVFE